MRAIKKHLDIEDSDLIQQGIRFIIRVDGDEKQLKETNMDVTMNRTVLPDYINKDMSFDKVTDLLVTVRNSFPLFVKVTSDEKTMNSPTIILTISRRFRQWKEIENWHQANELAPFMLVD